MVRSTARTWSAQTARTLRAAALLCALLGLSALPSGQSPADTVDPEIRITSPAEDATIAGTVMIIAEATDAGGVAGVTFEVDGRVLGTEVVVAPWSVAWNTSASGNGSHILTAIARDVAGNAVRSAVVPVVVGSAAPPPFPPPTNHNPTPAGDALTSIGGAPVTFTGASLLVNDTDPDNHALIVTLVAASSTEGGTIAANGSDSYTYTPVTGFTGVDRFTYSVADGFGGTATATVSVNVTAVPTPSPAGLVLSLGFDEESGLTALDGSGGSRNGTIRGALRVAGHSGRALQFDGVDDWVTVPDSAALDLTSGMTLEAWVNPTNAMSGWDTVMLKERGAGDMAYGLYGNDGAPRPAGYVNVGGTHTSAPGTTAVAPGAWTHLAATYDGATVRTYVNGALVSSRARTGAMVVSGGALRVGGNNAWPGEFFAGLIDDVRIYNRALTALEIEADMNGNATPPPPPPPPPVNHAPVAQADSLTTAAGTPASFTAALLLANDSDSDGDALSVSSVGTSSVAGGAIASSGAGAWTYTPAAGFSGTDSFTYTIADGHDGVATGTVQVTVTPAAPPPPPPPPPPTGGEGLVLALGFDEASGTTALDTSGGDRHGTIREAVRVAGKVGGALSFDGSNDWVTITDTTGSTLDLTAGLTIEAWINPETLNGWDTIVLKERGAGLLSYGLYAHDGAPLAGGEAVPAGYVRASGADRAVRGTSALALNTWTHVAVTYDGAMQRIYINGVLAASRAQAGPIAVGNGALRIGGNNSFANEFFRGMVDEVRIYNRALSAAEIVTDMNRGQ